MRDCCCGEPETPNVVHRALEPCYMDPKYLLDRNLRWELRLPWWKRIYLRLFRRYTG